MAAVKEAMEADARSDDTDRQLRGLQRGQFSGYPAGRIIMIDRNDLLLLAMCLRLPLDDGERQAMRQKLERMAGA